jgi:hypothetical protein
MIEKNYFTDKRNQQFTFFPNNKQLEIWGKYCYIPLDIPKIQSQNMVEWFNEKKKPIYKITSDISTKSIGFSNFDSIDVLPTGESEKKHRDSVAWDLNIQKNFVDLFPDVYKKIMEYFPFKSLDRIRIWSSTKDVGYHRDDYKYTDNPESFRLMLYDENPNQTLGLVTSLPDTNLNKDNIFLLPRIEDTNSFVWNNLRTKHGSVHDSRYKKIILIRIF